MSNPLFDDFLELDMLDMSTSPSTGSDMYPFLFSAGAELDSSLDPATAAAMSLLDDPLATTTSLSLDMDQTVEPSSHQQPLSEEEEKKKIKEEDDEAKLDPSLLAMATAAAASLGTNVNPSQLLLTPPAEPLIMSPTTATTSLFAPAPTPTPTNKDTTAVRSAKRARSNSLEPSAELGQQHQTTTATASPSTTTKTSCTTSRKSSISKALPEKDDTASLTSTTNTTLSAATLQFLLQQQAQAPLVPQLFSGTLTREEIDATLAQLLESTKHLLQPDTPPSSVTTTPGSGGAASSSSPLVKIKEEISDDDLDDMEGIEHAQPSTHGLKTQPGIKTDDIPSPTDLKKMTSKERRQLRNKISARNFRVRRKEYISTLEGQVQQHKTEARHLREAVTLVQDENLRLKKELEEVKRQLAETTISNASALAVAAAAAAAATPTTTTTTTNTTKLPNASTTTTNTNTTTTIATTASSVATTPSSSSSTVSSLDATTPTTNAAATPSSTTIATTTEDESIPTVVSPTPLSKENQSLLSAIMSKGVTNALHPNAKGNITLSMPRPQSPILLPNYHKDVPNSTSAAAAGQGSSWKDKNPILVHRTLVPEVYFSQGFELGDKPKEGSLTNLDDLSDRPWMQLCQGLDEDDEDNKVVVEQQEQVMQQTAQLAAEVERPHAHVQTETALHMDGMAILYEVMQTCAWTMWMGSTMGDEDGSLSWMLPQVEEEQVAQKEDEEEMYEQVLLQQMSEDSQMLEWLYESLMARLVEMDLQQTQQQQQHPQRRAGESASTMV